MTSIRGFNSGVGALIRRTGDPVSQLVSVADMCNYLRVSSDHEYGTVRALILAATDHLQSAIGKAFISQEWQLKIQAPVANKIELHKVPAIDIVEILYYDGNNEQQSLDIEDFEIIGNQEWAYIQPKQNKVWPTIYSRPDAIQVKYNAGFGDTPDSVPQDIIQALMMLVSHWFINRSAVANGSAQEVPYAVEAVINSHKIGWL